MQTMKKINHEIKARNKHIYLFLILLFKNLVFYIELKSLIITFSFFSVSWTFSEALVEDVLQKRRSEFKNDCIIVCSSSFFKELLRRLLLHFFASAFCKRVNVSRFLTKWRETHRLMYKESNSFVYKSAVK